MANPINPFSGGGGWGNVIPESYLPFTSEMTERWKSEKDAKTENILGTIAGTIGGLTGNAELANTLFPSAIGKYYQQASEAQGKAKAYEGLVKTSPELFGLSGDQAKAFTDFASKLPPTAVPEFYQMALKGGMQKQELASQTARTQIGISPAMGELELKKQQLLQSKVKSDEFMKAFDAVNNLFNQFGK